MPSWTRGHIAHPEVVGHLRHRRSISPGLSSEHGSTHNQKSPRDLTIPTEMMTPGIRQHLFHVPPLIGIPEKIKVAIENTPLSLAQARRKKVYTSGSLGRNLHQPPIPIQKVGLSRSFPISPHCSI